MDAADQVNPRREVDVLVIGGGVAASTFVNTLAHLRPNVTVGLVSPSPLLKQVSVLASTGRTLDQLQVQEVPLTSTPLHPRLLHWQDSASGLHASSHCLMTAGGGVIGYKYLCICTGARPLLLRPGDASSSPQLSPFSPTSPSSPISPFIVGLRDTESVDSLTRRLGECRKILLVGNGGIATELVYELKNCHIIWAVKDQAISATFFDAATANFFVPKLTFNKSNAEQSRKSLTSRRFVAHSGSNAALGPDWSFSRCLQGALQEKNVTVLYGCHVVSITENANTFTKGKNVAPSCKCPHTSCDSSSPSTSANPCNTCDKSHQFPVTAKLSNGQSVDCDLIISATGVTPNVEPFLCNNDFTLSTDGALKVNRDMETSVKDVFAAGDVCHPEWQDECELWLHMRLWTQARQMALYAAHCIDSKFEQEEGCSTSSNVVKTTTTTTSEEEEQENKASHKEENNSVPGHRLYFNFDIFSHVTTFFGYKVVLLGLFNGQKLNNDYKILFRQDEDEQCIKLVIKDGKIKGAILIGDTDLEETFENLIISQIDVSRIEEQLLDGIVDIEDYFD